MTSPWTTPKSSGLSPETATAATCTCRRRGPPVVSTARIGPNGKSKLIGPHPTRTAIRAAAGSVDGLLAAHARRTSSVAPVLWNTVHLVVTGVTPTHALLVALHHADEYPAKDLEERRAAAAGDAAALEAAFTETTGRTLPAAARPWLAPRGNDRRPGGPAKTRRRTAGR